jgi:hypothetical protein
VFLATAKQVIAVTGATGATGPTGDMATHSGGSNWFTIGAAAVTGVGLIIAAGIAAWTTNRRQREQLDHDRDMKILDLDYDRRRRDIEHLREFLDEAGEVFDARYVHFGELESAHEMEKWWNEREPYEGEDEEQRAQTTLEYAQERNEALAEDISRQSAMFAMLRRMDLRLPRDHPIRQEFNLAAECFDDARGAVSGDLPVTREQWDASTEKTNEALRHWANLVVAAEEIIGVAFSYEVLEDLSDYQVEHDEGTEADDRGSEE